MAAAGLDIDGRKGTDGHALTIQLDIALPFQNEIDLGHLFMIMGPGILLNIYQVHAGRILANFRKSAACPATRTAGGRRLVELRKLKISHAPQASACGRGCSLAPLLEILSRPGRHLAS